MCKTLATVLFLAFCPFMFAQQSMNNEAVLKMVKAGLSDNIVLSTINASPGIYTTSPDALIAMKQAGVSDKIIAAIVNKHDGASAATTTANADGHGQTTPPGDSRIAQQLAPTPTAPQGNMPRVYLESQSKGPSRYAARDQSMEMSKDFEKNCPGVRVTINQQVADYTVLLNHIEVGFVRDNQFQIANKNGDLISKTKEGGSIGGGVKKACATILADWGQTAH
jgi:hypothetical protein